MQGRYKYDRAKAGDGHGNRQARGEGNKCERGIGIGNVIYQQLHTVAPSTGVTQCSEFFFIKKSA